MAPATVLFVAVVVQIIYVRAMLATYEKEKVKYLSSAWTTEAGRGNTLKVYGLRVSRKHTIAAKDVAKLSEGGAMSATLNGSMYVLCGGSPAAKDVVFKDGFWLVVERNTGASNLINDVLTGRTRYMLVDNALYVVAFDRESSESAKAAMRSSTGVDRGALEEQELLYVARADGAFSFRNAMDALTCSTTSYMRVFKLSSGTASASGLLAQVESAGGDLPLIAAGFSTS